MKKILLYLFLISITILLCGMFDSFYAYSYDIDNLVLFYKEDYKELESDIKKYISNIDDYIIPNSSYLYGDRLVDNYDFLVYFASDYILNNREYYSNYIINYNKCSYLNKSGIESYTYNYIELDKIYDITGFYFGIRDFIIVNDDICINDNYISLIDYTSDRYNFEIVDINIVDSLDDIEVVISYDNGDSYLYLFDNVNNILKLKNIEVV